MTYQKGSVENLVGWVKGSFFKVRRFHDREDLQRQLSAWLEEVNTQRPSRATNEIPAQRMEAERKRLSPLTIPPAEYPLRFSAMRSAIDELPQHYREAVKLHGKAGFADSVSPVGWIQMPWPRQARAGQLHLNCATRLGAAENGVQSFENPR